MAKRVPGSREEDSWFSEEQLDGLARADDVDDLGSPIPTQMVSMAAKPVGGVAVAEAWVGGFAAAVCTPRIRAWA